MNCPYERYFHWARYVTACKEPSCDRDFSCTVTSEPPERATAVRVYPVHAGGSQSRKTSGRIKRNSHRLF